jgi:pimeloyl-ACP methyl ester carboxylesterase
MVGRTVPALLAGVLTVAGALMAPAPATAAERIVDAPVAFTVQNVNRSASQCPSDGRTYTIRGHLTAPESLLRRARPAVTLYVHGTNTGEWIWRLPNGEGTSFVQALARRGHASVTIDRLGYGASDRPDGFAGCTGSHADIAHQIVQQLRSGGYQATGRAPTRFSSVVMGGHSSGALVAEATAYSFGGVDGLVLTAWAPVGLTGDTNRRFFGAYERCLAGGEPRSGPGDPGGYVYFDGTRAEFLAGGLSAAASPRVRAAVAPLHARNPCGVMVSEPMAILQDLTLLDRVTVPVFAVFGEKDVLRQDVERYPGLFTSSPDVSAMTVAGAGHFVTIDTNAATMFTGVADWLDRHERRT